MVRKLGVVNAEFICLENPEEEDIRYFFELLVDKHEKETIIRAIHLSYHIKEIPFSKKDNFSIIQLRQQEGYYRLFLTNGEDEGNNIELLKEEDLFFTRHIGEEFAFYFDRTFIDQTIVLQPHLVPIDTDDLKEFDYKEIVPAQTEFHLAVQILMNQLKKGIMQEKECFYTYQHGTYTIYQKELLFTPEKLEEATDEELNTLFGNFSDSVY